MRVFLNQTFTLTFKAFDPDGQNVSFVFMTNADYQLVERIRRRRDESQMAAATFNFNIKNTGTTSIMLVIYFPFNFVVSYLQMTQRIII